MQQSRPASDRRRRVTELLQAWSAGDRSVEGQLARAVHAELHRMAQSFMRRERSNHTLEPAGLVNEAYLRLVRQDAVSWESRGHFYAIAAKLMRRILLDHAKGRSRLKRGGAALAVSFDEALELPGGADYTGLYDALEALDGVDPRAASVVELRFFAGLTQEEVAAHLGCSVATVARDWQFAKAFLFRSLQ